MKKKNAIIKSPLRYPGGKTRALSRILVQIPRFDEYREPMVGGGSVFFAVKQINPDKKYWINDKNSELYLFWKLCRDNPAGLVAQIRKFRRKYTGKKLFKYLMKTKDTLSDLQRAARFFILNRITFSGLAESGGYSNEAFRKRFTKSSIERVKDASKILQGVKITNLDYSKVLRGGGRTVFSFLDPPYMANAEAKLYGKKGKFHTNFDHKLFYKNMKECAHNCLITYDNCSGIKKIYRFTKEMGWTIRGWKLQYGMNNYKQKKAKKGKELFISNYKVRVI